MKFRIKRASECVLGEKDFQYVEVSTLDQLMALRNATKKTPHSWEPPYDLVIGNHWKDKHLQITIYDDFLE